MTRLLAGHEMEDGEMSLDRDQGSLPEYERRPPRRDKVAILIIDRLLNEPGPVEGEARIEVMHLVWFVGRLQRDLLCLNVNK